MTTTDTVTELDAAVTGEGTTSSFEEEYPDAPQWAIELSEQIEETAARNDEIEQAKQERRARLKHSLETRIAAMAIQAGVATEEEKQLVKEAREADEQYSNLDDLAKFFTPETTEESNQ